MILLMRNLKLVTSNESSNELIPARPTFMLFDWGVYPAAANLTVLERSKKYGNMQINL